VAWAVDVEARARGRARLCGGWLVGWLVLGLGWEVDGDMEDAEDEVSCCRAGLVMFGRLMLGLMEEIIRSEVDRRLMDGRWNAASPLNVALGSCGEVAEGRDWSFRSDANGRKLGESSSSSSAWALTACVCMSLSKDGVRLCVDDGFALRFVNLDWEPSSSESAS
jgi:hypothetical protein